jgi:hypothetical protein
MNLRPILSVLSALALGCSVHAAGVAVGSSTLINQLDYSDTFTLGVGNRTSLAPNAYPIGAGPALLVENVYGNPSRSWSNSLWSISNDPNAINGGMIYPGGSGAGSATGMTQTGGGEVNSGFEYDLRNDILVQFDAVQVSDRVNISIGSARDTIFSSNSLSVFFRSNGHPTLPEVGIYSPSVGEISAGLDTGPASLDNLEWHNFAVRFNLPANQLTVWVDQVNLGTVDLATLGGPKVGGGTITAGAYVAALNATTNDFVNVGTTGGDRTWTDNFQVGAPIPEPSLPALAGLAGGLAVLRRQRRRHQS